MLQPQLRVQSGWIAIWVLAKWQQEARMQLRMETFTNGEEEATDIKLGHLAPPAPCLTQMYLGMEIISSGIVIGVRHQTTIYGKGPMASTTHAQQISGFLQRQS